MLYSIRIRNRLIFVYRTVVTNIITKDIITYSHLFKANEYDGSNGFFLTHRFLKILNSEINLKF